MPFDILEAESELVAGFRVEYSGMKFAIIQLAEYAHMLGTSFLGALLFLGAWAGPGPAWLGPVWFLLKAMFVFLLLTWMRWSFVRIRVDQILAISWKLMLPATLLLLLATAPSVVVEAPVRDASSAGSARSVGRSARPSARRCGSRSSTSSASPSPSTIPTVERRLPGPLPRPARADLRQGDRRGELHRLPAVRVHLPARGDQGRDAEGGEAELRQDLHPRALRLRVLRAVRAGVPDRRHHHDEVVRHAHARSPRDAARQGPAARHRPPARAVVGDRQRPARHAGAAQDGARPRPAPTPRRKQGAGA